MFRLLHWYEWALWAIEACLLVLIWVRSWVPAQRQLMGYFLATSAVKFALIWGPAGRFADAYYWFQLPEDLLVAAAAISTCYYVYPRYKSVLTWFGPIIMAVPAFFILLINRQVTILEPAELLATVAVGGSLLLVGGCLFLQQANDRQCWGYFGFLAFQLAGAQLHLRYGYSSLGRLGPELGQVMGLACLCWTWVLGRVVTNGGWSPAETHFSLKG